MNIDIFIHVADCNVLLICPFLSKVFMQAYVHTEAAFKEAMHASEDATLPVDFKDVEAIF